MSGRRGFHFLNLASLNEQNIAERILAIILKRQQKQIAKPIQTVKVSNCGGCDRRDRQFLEGLYDGLKGISNNQ